MMTMHPLRGRSDLRPVAAWALSGAILFTVAISEPIIGRRASAAVPPASTVPAQIENDAATTPPSSADGAADAALEIALPPVATGSRGLVGTYVVEYVGPRLRAKPDQAITAPLIVRVLDEPAPAGSTDAAASTPRYRIEFIGTVVGTYDLRELIEHADGSGAAALPPLPVRIDSELPSAHGTDLFLEDRPVPALRSWYRVGMILLVLAWLAIPVIAIVRRAMRRTPPVVVEPPAPPPTLADRLRPLVEAAMRGELSVPERARLELLLIDVWRDRLGLAALPPAQALIRLRRDPQAGELLRAVEGWLHAPATGASGASAAGSGSSVPAADLAALLEPYRSIDASAFPESAFSRHAGGGAPEPGTAAGTAAAPASATGTRIGAHP